MLKCLQLEDIERQLLEVPALVDSYEQHNSNFAGTLRNWLVSLEDSFQQNRLPQAGAIAVKRALLVSAGRGVVPEGLSVQGRVTRRKLQAAAAIHALRWAAELVANSIQADQERHRQAREMVSNIVAVAVAKALHGFGNGSSGCSDQDRWSSLLRDKDTQGAAIQLQGLVGLADAMILLNRKASGS